MSLPADTPVLEVDRLTVSYAGESGRIRAVDEVSFAIRRGEVLGLVGESGSGKSTIAGAITRLLAPNAVIESGRILLGGEDLLTKSEAELRVLRGNRVAVVFQNPLNSLTPSMRVGEQIAEILRVHKGLDKTRSAERAVELLASVGIPAPQMRAGLYPHQLSGGMQQRTVIAAALACDPDVLILDEPTTALDVTTEANILDLVIDLKTRVDAAILYITHDLGVVARVCDRVAVLYASRMLEEATVDEIFSEPWHPYTLGLLASVPRVNRPSAGRRLAAIPGRIPPLAALTPACAFGSRCPFAAGGCAARPQVLAAAAGRRVRCERSEQTRVRSWPEDPAGADSGRVREDALLVQTDALVKVYGERGWFPRLGFERRGLGVRVVPRDDRVVAVDGVSLELRTGETLGLVGESGCGKSTLGRMLVRLIDPSAGRIVHAGTDITELAGPALRTYRRAAQIVFQNPESSLNPRHRIGNILARPLIAFGLARPEELENRVAALLETVQLPADYARRYPHELSGGERQRVGIARALATKPGFVVCDEPVTALDVSVRASILNLLTSLQARLGLTYLFIAHDLAIIRHIADRVAVMYRGRICEIGTTADVFAPPFHPYTRALLSAIPVPDPAIARRTQRIRLADVGVPARTRNGCVFGDRCPAKIGSLCDEVAPPARIARPGHTIHCHHALPALLDLDLPRLAGAA